MNTNIIRTAAVALAGAATIAGLGALGTGTAAAAPVALPSGCYDIWGPGIPVPNGLGMGHPVVGQAHVDGTTIAAFGQRGRIDGTTITIAGLHGTLGPADAWHHRTVAGIPGIDALSEGCTA
ncbi:hypothetical protein [Tsukamurella spumae]|uniref:Uncharacterized protein n=1 Tax=Tsukamurella spumae TaxID=44753 RepID=A0A846X9D8_9ACTN|nr:hypothetical protein [Tsukamurella spumae]NKY20879.1 hypothetical protein [Tsukamurella spumae]